MSWWNENWQWAVGSLTGLVGVAVALLSYARSRNPKRLDYRIVHNIPILAAKMGDLKHRLKVTYNDRPVTNPRIVTIRILNNGERAIRRDEYERAVTIFFARNSPIDGFISDASSANIDAQLRIDSDGSGAPVTTVRPGLLNPGEWVDVQLICDGVTGKITVASRFADQAGAMRELDRAPKGVRARLVIFNSVLILSGGFAIAELSGAQRVWLLVILLAAFAFTTLLSLVLYRNMIRIMKISYELTD